MNEVHSNWDKQQTTNVEFLKSSIAAGLDPARARSRYLEEVAEYSDYHAIYYPWILEWESMHYEPANRSGLLLDLAERHFKLEEAKGLEGAYRSLLLDRIERVRQGMAEMGLPEEIRQALIRQRRDLARRRLDRVFDQERERRLPIDVRVMRIATPGRGSSSCGLPILEDPDLPPSFSPW
jgi:hypothetical protein